MHIIDSRQEGGRRYLLYIGVYDQNENGIGTTIVILPSAQCIIDGDTTANEKQITVPANGVAVHVELLNEYLELDITVPGFEDLQKELHLHHPATAAAATAEPQADAGFLANLRWQFNAPSRFAFAGIVAVFFLVSLVSFLFQATWYLQVIAVVVVAGFAAALVFWPDSRGYTGKTLNAGLRTNNRFCLVMWGITLLCFALALFGAMGSPFFGSSVVPPSELGKLWDSIYGHQQAALTSPASWYWYLARWVIAIGMLVTTLIYTVFFAFVDEIKAAFLEAERRVTERAGGRVTTASWIRENLRKLLKLPQIIPGIHPPEPAAVGGAQARPTVVVHQGRPWYMEFISQLAAGIISERLFER